MYPESRPAKWLAAASPPESSLQGHVYSGSAVIGPTGASPDAASEHVRDESPCGLHVLGISSAEALEILLFLGDGGGKETAA